MAQENVRKRASERILPDPTSTPAAESDATKPSTPAELNTRLSVPINPKTGKLDFDSMRASTREKLKAALADPAARAALGDAGGGVALSADDAALNGVLVNMLYDVIGSIGVVVAQTRGFQAAHAEVLRYTEQEKAILAPTTLKVLNKYNLLGGKYADEIALVAAVGSVTAGHIMALRQLAAASPTIVPAPLTHKADAS